jgi:OOP family OmpA-OmpF porin
VTGAGHDATAGHLRDGHGSPVWTGNKECVNLGFSVGKDHAADCVVQAPAAKTPEPPAPTQAAAVPPPEKKAEPPAPAPVATVPATTEGVNADAVTDPTTKWSKQGAAAAPAKPAEAPAPAPVPAETPPATAEAPAAVTAQPETPYPAPMPEFPELEPRPQVEEQGPIGDAPPYEVPGPNVGGQPEVALVPTDPQGAGDAATDPATKWSKEGADAQPLEGSTQLPQDSVAGTPVAPPEPVAEAPRDLQSPEPYQPAAPAAVPPPEKVAQEAPPPPKPAEPEKIPAPEYEKFTLGADALFKFDRYTRKFMLPEGRQKLDELAATLNRYTGVQSFNIIGHTDRIGSHKYNDRLSLRRAATVKQYLAEKGVDANLMKISGKGKRQPVVNCPGKKVTKKLKACLQPNRRVEVEVRGERQKQ